MLSAGFVLAAASCSDYSDYNSVPVDGNAAANQTLWQNISVDQQLTKFKALAEKCHYDQVLNSPRFYTVWAPTDDAFPEAEFTALMASDSATIVNQFFQHHMADYGYNISANTAETRTIISLNEKHHPFSSASFDGFGYSATNQPSTNGVMHKISGMSKFHHNLYENIDNLKGCDSIKQYIQSYDEYYLDLNASVVGPLIDGKQTYLDSVMKKRNTVINSIMRADLSNEDSTYCMIIPNDRAWTSAYDSIKPRYKFIAKLDYMDLSKKTSVASSTTATTAKADKAIEVDPVQLSDSLTKRSIISNLVYSKYYKRNAPLFGEGTFSPLDSIYSTSHSYLQGADEIIAHTVDSETMSNGITRVVDSLTFSPWQMYEPTIVSTSPDQTLKVKKLTNHSIPKMDLASRADLFSKVPGFLLRRILPQNSQFFSYVAVDSANVDGTSGKPEFNFALRNVRSTTYHIYVVTVPAQVEEPTAPVKPYWLRFYLSWTDASNKQQYTILPQGSKSTIEMTTDNAPEKPDAKYVYLGDPAKVNVFDLGEFTFPVSYAGLDAYPSLMMMHTKTYTSSGNRSKYDQQMRVAGVYLVPKKYVDFYYSNNNE